MSDSTQPHAPPRSMAHRGPARAIGAWYAAAMAAAALLFVLAYGGSLDNAFHFDDAHVIESNPAIRSAASVPRYFTDARTFSSLPANQTYRPVVTLTLAADHALARTTTGDGLDTRAYHVSQLAFLALVAVLLGGLARRIYMEAAAGDDRLVAMAPFAAIVAATLFAVHTGNSQVGNYISARSESLSAAGLLGGFLLYLRGGAWRRLHLYLVPMAIGALAKPPAILLAPLLLVWRVLAEEGLGTAALHTRAARSALLRAITGTLPAFAAALALYLFVEGMNPPEQTYGGGSLPQYLWTQAWVSLRYVGTFIVPVGLSADTDWGLLPSPADVRVLGGVAALALSLWVAWVAASQRNSRPITLGILWFWIGLAPTAVVPLAEVTNDHRPFLSFVGLAIACVWGVALLLRHVAMPRRRMVIGTTLAAAVLLAHAVGTRARSRVWATEASLWASVVRASPANARGLMNFGLSAMRGARYVEARALFDSAARLAPAYPLVYVNRAIAAGAQGDGSAAETDFQHALSLDPSGAAPHRYFARWLAENGRGPEALQHYAAAIEARPLDPDARTEWLLLLAAAGDPAAGTVARATLELDPTNDVALALAAGQPSVPPLSDAATSRSAAQRWYLAGLALTATGHHVEAVQAYRAAVAADSLHAASWNNLGWSLGKLGFLGGAEAALVEAVSLAPRDTLARNNLAWIRASRSATIVAAPPSNPAGGP